MEENSQFHTVRGYQLLEKRDNYLTSAMEDYLEMIYRNSLTEGYMRIITLSELLNVAAPSATKMVQKLSLLGFLDYKKYGIIFLTDRGKEAGRVLLQRHEIIQNFLENIGVRENLLLETELIEHSISSATMKKISLYNQFIENNPAFREEFYDFLKENEQK